MATMVCARTHGRFHACLLIVVMACSAPAIAAADPSVIVPFSTALPGMQLPAPWRLASIKGLRATRFTLVEDGGDTVLRAQADASMASVMHPLNVDPNAFPVLRWRWKVSNVLKKSDIRERTADDFPARVYVLFDYDIAKLTFLQRVKILVARARYGKDVPAAALCYVWDAKAPVGLSAWSPYTDRVRVLVVESGTANVNRWHEVERNLVADFRAAFGEEPPAISGVALAADTDNTGESVTTLFGNVRLAR